MSALRLGAALVLAALAAALGALILGEYEFEGMLPWVAGPLFGLVIAEIVVSVGRQRWWPVAVVTGGIAFGGMAWAGWIASSEGLEPRSALSWVAAGLAAVAAIARTVEWRRRPPT